MTERITRYPLLPPVPRDAEELLPWAFLLTKAIQDAWMLLAEEIEAALPVSLAVPLVTSWGLETGIPCFGFQLIFIDTAGTREFIDCSDGNLDLLCADGVTVEEIELTYV